MIREYMLPAGMALVMTAGCATPRLTDISPRHSLGSDLPAHVATSHRADHRDAPEPPEPTGILTLRQALSLALLKNPSLEVTSREVRVAEALTLQAGLPPNPEIEIEIDEYDHEGRGFDSSVTAIVFGQVLELGGKRKWRRRVAEAEGELAGWEYESKRLDVLTETTESFVDVLAAQKRVDLAATTADLAGKTSMAVVERVEAGKEPPLQAAKANAELEMALLTFLEAEEELAAARSKLAAGWGSERAVFEKAEGDLDHVFPALPDFESLRTRLPRNPDLARWDTELKLRKAALASEKAGRIPDLEASAGILSFREDGTDAFTFGLGVPLPLFDRNQGNIAAAGHELAKARSERKAEQASLLKQLVEEYASLKVSHRKTTVLKEQVVPARLKAFEAAHIGYEQGKFEFLEVLDAQRSLFEAKQELIDALNEYHGALAAIQRTTATSINELTTVTAGDE